MAYWWKYLGLETSLMSAKETFISLYIMAGLKFSQWINTKFTFNCYNRLRSIHLQQITINFPAEVTASFNS